MRQVTYAEDIRRDPELRKMTEGATVELEEILNKWAPQIEAKYRITVSVREPRHMV